MFPVILLVETLFSVFCSFQKFFKDMEENLTT